MYLSRSNNADFPTSCCVEETAGGNLTCPENVGDARMADPAVFKKKVRKCS